MKTRLTVITCAVFFAAVANAAPKTHVVTLGRAITISLRTEDPEAKPLEVKIRPLSIDGRVKEFTIGSTHDVTERTFVVQRIYRVNDLLPQESGPGRWRWQIGGWLLVDRTSGKVQQIALAGLDPEDSLVSWFRDYAAYCGVSDDGQKLSAMVIQLGRRKPLLKKKLAKTDAPDNSAPACSAPVWERAPVRVTFEPTPDQKLTFVVNRRAIADIPEADQIAADGAEEGE